MGVKDILPLMKWVKNLDLNVTSFSNPIPIFFFLDDYPSSKLMFFCSLTIVSIDNLLLGALVCENRSWLAPQILINIGLILHHQSLPPGNCYNCIRLNFLLFPTTFFSVP
jgi:hypothetical protein